MGLEYPVLLTQADGGGVTATLPDFPDIRVSGGYDADALGEASRALTAALAACVKARVALPAPSTRTGLPLVPVSAQVEVKLRLYEAMRQAGVSEFELARRLRWYMPQVDRLLALQHGSRLDQLEAGLAALGKRLSITLEDRHPSPRASAVGKSRRRRRARSTSGTD